MDPEPTREWRCQSVPRPSSRMFTRNPDAPDTYSASRSTTAQNALIGTRENFGPTASHARTNFIFSHVFNHITKIQPTNRNAPAVTLPMPDLPPTHQKHAGQLRWKERK